MVSVKHAQRTIRDVWTSYAAEDDLRGAFSDGFLAGLSTSEIEVLIDDAIGRAAALIERPEIQRAIYALAEALPNSGRLSGKQAGQIIAQALSQESIGPVG
jgi:hypothetical protein